MKAIDENRILKKRKGWEVILNQNQFPYLLTVLFVMIGWSLNRIITNLTEAPTIEYSCSIEEKKEGICYTYSLINLSKDNQFDSLMFDLEPEDQVVVVGAEIITHAPASTRVIDRKFKNNLAKFMIYKFQPGAVYDLVLITDKKVGLRLSFISKTGIRLAPASFKTWLVKNELEVIVALLLVWISFIFLYLKFLRA